MYSMGFVTGGIFYLQSILVAELYLDKKDWHITRQFVVNNNLLQQRTQSSTIRVSHEIIQRLKLLTLPQLELLCDGTQHEQNLLLWIAICKNYEFIADFTLEVIREKIRGLNLFIDIGDYYTFFNAKEYHDMGLMDLRDSTRTKIRQVLFRMLHEADILTGANRIILRPLPARVAAVIVPESPQYLLLLPVTDSDIMEAVAKL